MKVPRSTMSEEAYKRIRAAILDGRLRPGTHVTVRPLTEEFALSATPVKAALTALEREGFLTLVPHRGYFVTEVSRTDMHEIYELREVLDGIAARRSATVAGHAELAARLRELLDLQRACVDRGELAAYSDLDVSFHRMILEACGNVRLLRVADNLLGQLRLGRAVSIRAPGRLSTSLAEHAEIIAAIEAGQGGRAERVIRRHVRGARDALATEGNTVDSLR